MTDPREIAARLTEAQREAVCGRYAWQSPIDEEQGEVALYQLGLWNPRPKYGQKAITPLGLAVRKAIADGEHITPPTA